jgi:SAM-dependent methyltransferase
VSHAVRHHYDTLLAPIYSWSLGDLDARVGASYELLQGVLGDAGGGRALDLGCGTGVQTLALSRLGYRVTGIDFSAVMLQEYRTRTSALGATAIEADLAQFDAGGGFAVAVCFGDTVSHLASWEDVRALFANVHRSLETGGHFLLASRDHSRVYRGDERFLLVRADATRSLTCVLEDEGEHVRVTDVVHARVQDRCSMNVSSYRKLRVSPSTLRAALHDAGFEVLRSMEIAGGVSVLHATVVSS